MAEEKNMLDMAQDAYTIYLGQVGSNETGRGLCEYVALISHGTATNNLLCNIAEMDA